MSESISLAGAERGKFQPWREIKGGLWFEEGDQFVNKPCAVRLTTRRVAGLCYDYARQYLSQRGDKTVTAGQIADLSVFLLMHHVLIHVPSPDGKMRPLCPFPGLGDKDGKVNAAAVNDLPLHSLTDGQLSRLVREYELLKETQTPDRGLTHAEWEALITEGKTSSLAALHSKHGSSALIQVLHGLDGVPYPQKLTQNRSASMLSSKRRGVWCLVKTGVSRPSSRDTHSCARLIFRSILAH